MEITTFFFVYFSLLVFAMGACVGSFLNVCIYRIPREESVVTPRSHCPHCSKMIPWNLNIPLFSFLMLGGRCQTCKNVISIRYFLVELMTAVLFLLVWLHYGFDARTPIYCMMIAGLILGTFVDFEHMIIPDRVTLGGVVAGLVLSPLVPSLHDVDRPLESFVAALIGMVAGAGILWGVGFLGKLAFKKDAMGMGDVKLLGGLGALLGWQAVLFTIMVSALVGSGVGVALILGRNKEWRSRIPYGPYLALAAVIWILWGKQWWDGYFAWVASGTL
jgi:leader peptidase (prepilin peptidase) / N-methyltransferase